MKSRCDVRYCRYSGYEIYFLHLTKEDYKHFKLYKRITKKHNAMCYKHNSYYVIICPKHYRQIFNNQDYINEKCVL